MDAMDMFIAGAFAFLDFGLAIVNFCTTLRKGDSETIKGIDKKGYIGSRVWFFVFFILGVQKLVKPEWTIKILVVELLVTIFGCGLYCLYLPFKYKKKVWALAVKEKITTEILAYGPDIEENVPGERVETEQILFVYEYNGQEYKVNSNYTTYASKIKVKEGLTYKIWINPKNPEDTFTNPWSKFICGILMEIADKIEKVKTVCWCGRKATCNARICDGKIVRNGEQVLMSGNESYIALCRKHFKKGKLTVLTISYNMVEYN